MKQTDSKLKRKCVCHCHCDCLQRAKKKNLAELHSVHVLATARLTGATGSLLPNMLLDYVYDFLTVLRPPI